MVFPVFQPGGLLFVGDLHASMGAAEPCWVGLEAAGAATLRVSLVKGAAPPFPRLTLDNGQSPPPLALLPHLFQSLPYIDASPGFLTPWYGYFVRRWRNARVNGGATDPCIAGAGDEVFTAALGEESHDDASQHALDQAYKHLVQDRGLTPEEAFGNVYHCRARR